MLIPAVAPMRGISYFPLGETTSHPAPPRPDAVSGKPPRTPPLRRGGGPDRSRRRNTASQAPLAPIARAGGDRLAVPRNGEATAGGMVNRGIVAWDPVIALPPAKARRVTSSTIDLESVGKLPAGGRSSRARGGSSSPGPSPLAPRPARGRGMRPGPRALRSSRGRTHRPRRAARGRRLLLPVPDDRGEPRLIGVTPRNGQNRTLSLPSEPESPSGSNFSCFRPLAGPGKKRKFSARPGGVTALCQN